MAFDICIAIKERKLGLEVWNYQPSFIIASLSGPESGGLKLVAVCTTSRQVFCKRRNGGIALKWCKLAKLNFPVAKW